MFDLPTNGDEEWGRVPNWARYWVSTHGRIYSEPKQARGAGGTSGGLMSPSPQTNGYPMITLQCAYQKKGRTVHSLVMEVHGPQPPTPNHDVINHIDGDKTNNRLENLEWVTEAENRLHAGLKDALQSCSHKEVIAKVKSWTESLTT
jgi:hypothetical protein